MDWVTSTLFWYIHLFFIGLIFLPVTEKLFGKFLDQGYAFSKTLGIICISYLSFLLGILHIAPFTQLALYFVVGVFGIGNLYLYLKGEDRGTFISVPFSRQFIFIFEELLFLAAILFLAYVRGQEPSVHGLEKFMDFGFINSILKSTHFPPLDMWYSAGPDLKGVEHATGFPINYYYFGHLTGAMLIKLTGIPASVGYNLILATIFAQGVTLAFSLVMNIVYIAQKTKNTVTSFVFGILGSFLLNLGGNLHTIYLFTKGYSNDSPVPFWKIFSSFNPEKYWYPNATRFIPFTIHEFPSYSYVVADLHGHVFDIPFVLLTLAVLFHMVYSHFTGKRETHRIKEVVSLKNVAQMARKILFSWNGLLTIFLGFMCGVQYMTNAFDGPFYLLLTLIFLFIMYRISYTFLTHSVVLILTYLLVSLPFTAHFSLFVSGIGVNCAPNFLFDNSAAPGTAFKVGPLLFEKGNCQKSPFWMMFTLWGFFWTNFAIFLAILAKERRLSPIDSFMLILFTFGTCLLIIPEFVYVKDIYPAHFRANTMFKLGYQAFMMMSIASTYVLYRVKQLSADRPYLAKILGGLIFVVFLIILQTQPTNATQKVASFPFEYFLFIPLFFLIIAIFIFRRKTDLVLSLLFTYILFHLIMLVSVYPFFSFPSYYANLQKSASQNDQNKPKTSLDGQAWLETQYPEDLEIINYINTNIPDQPIILEAQGDSYTDYERISAYTGNPTISGWWVHEWLWRGSPDVVGKRIPDISTIYESSDLVQTRKLLRKYNVKYVVVSQMERKKYPNVNVEKFTQLGTLLFRSSNGFGALYQVD